jgi:hypothetical protein
MSVDDCASYFVVKWFLDVKAYAPPQDWYEPSTLRDDCRLAFAAMSKVLRGIGNERAADAVDELRASCANVLALDYMSWVRG